MIVGRDRGILVSLAGYDIFGDKYVGAALCTLSGKGRDHARLTYWSLKTPSSRNVHGAIVGHLQHAVGPWVSARRRSIPSASPARTIRGTTREPTSGPTRATKPSAYSHSNSLFGHSKMNASSSLALTLIQSSDRRPEAEHPEQQRPERGGVLVLNRVEPIPIEEAQANVDANSDTNTNSARLAQCRAVRILKKGAWNVL